MAILVLRFRDLATPRGDTIRLHADISERQGRVWWGWWSKAEEVVPAAQFGALKRDALACGLDVLLFDSGQDVVHTARCIDIHWDPTGQRVRSPDPASTPDYYREQVYLAWFCLTDIQRIPTDPAILGLHTYVRVDEFFKGGESRFARFYGKRIASPQELRLQDRTIWFVRAAEAADPAYEILLTDERLARPTHFVDSHIETGQDALLWMSDLHFSTEGHHAFPIQPGQVLGEPLHVRLEKALTDLKVVPAGIVVSGDLTWKAAGAEFDAAFASLDYLRRWAHMESYQIAVCPGNHDLAFSDAPQAKTSPVTYAIDAARAGYASLYERLFFLPPNGSLSSGRRYLLSGSLPIELALLNSSALQQHPGLFQGHGFLGEAQLAEVTQSMGWKRAAGLNFRVAVIHHHLVPVTYREAPEYGVQYSVVLDAGAFARWLVDNRVRLLIHGHMHEPFAARLSLPLDPGRPEGDWHDVVVVGMGSTGVARSHVPEGHVNTFGLLRFAAGGVTIEVHSLSPTLPSGLLRRFTLPFLSR